MSKVKYIAVVLLTVLLGGLIGFSASAETNETEVEVQFTFEPFLSMSISEADLIINDLAPGTAKNSNEIGVTVKTNNVTGYKLSATVGDTTNDSRDLKHATLAAAFTSIDTGAVLTSLTTDNTWGYSINSGTSFSGLSKYNSAAGTELNSSDSAADETTNFLIGARAASSQQSGDYSNVISFAAVTNYVPTNLLKDADSLQTLAAEACLGTDDGMTATLIDERDQQEYTIGKIAGLCWMTQNLNYDLATNNTLSPETSNVASTKTVTASKTASFSTSTYTTLNTRAGSTKENGYYYNYCAATAGEICTGNGTAGAAATQDVCPAGWRLPTTDEQKTLINYASQFAPVKAGYYNNTSLTSSGTYGYYWASSTYSSANYRSTLRYYSTSLASSSLYRYRGANVRCIHDYTPGTVTIAFDGNGNTSGNMSPITVAAGSSTTLTANSYAKTGHAFVSWNTQPDGSGTTYMDGASYAAAIRAGDSKVTLYAQWGKNVGSMIAYDNATCSAEAANAPVIGTDPRDGKSYSLRYINGQCWMTQNLAYDLKTNNTLSPDTSNVASETTVSTVDDLTSSYSYTTAQIHAPTTEDLAQSGLSAEATGYWYNYCAATAGEICSDPDNDYENPLNTKEASQSVCPAGWRLPTDSEQSGITGAKNQFLPVYGGYWSNGTLYNATTYGLWWSSTAYDGYLRWYLDYYGGSLSTGSDGRYLGLYVRCVRAS